MLILFSSKYGSTKLNPATMIRIRTATIFLFVFLAMACQHKELDLPLGKAPFLQQRSARVDSLLAEMTIDEKIGQLIHVQIDAPLDKSLEKIAHGVALQRIGGLELRGLTLDRFLNFKDSLSLHKQDLFWSSREALLLNGQFSDIEKLPAINSIQALQNDTLRAEVEKLHFNQLSALNLNWGIAPVPHKEKNTPYWFEMLTQRRILSVAPWPNYEEILQSDLPKHDAWHAYRDQATWGLSGIRVKWSPIIQDSSEARTDFLTWKIQQQTGFDGLVAGELEKGVDPVQFLKAGADQLIVHDSWNEVFLNIQKAIQTKEISPAAIDRKVHRVLLAKEWTNQVATKPQSIIETPPLVKASFGPNLSNADNPGKNASISVSNLLKEHFKDPDWVVLKHALYRQSMILLSNPKKLMPFDLSKKAGFKITQYTQIPFYHFQKQFEKYADFQSHLIRQEASEPLTVLDPGQKKNRLNIVLLDQQINKAKDAKFIKSITQAAAENPLVLINFGSAKNIAAFDSSLAIIQIYERNGLTERMVVQLLFGAIGAEGQLPETINPSFILGQGLKTTPTRMAYAIPQEVGIAPEKLVGIDAIMRSAIGDRIIPGGQILVAKEGKVIYSKAFGHHTFNKKEKVDEYHLYDVASITKVAATTLAAMQLYDLKKYKLNDRLQTHLKLIPESTIKNISIKKLMIHQSGLQSNMPIAPYVFTKDEFKIDCENFFCYRPDESFSVQIASKMYFNRSYQDSLWEKMQTLRLRSQTGFRYSDVNFMLIQRLVETKTNKSLDKWVSKHFYQPLGLRFSTFNPLNKFNDSQIIPTQNDQRWRKQLLRGYVHDESAALMGGVGGSAGLFTTAEDLAVIFQMLLNRGLYGGRRYLETSTVDLFTSSGHGNHRGLGFDKPSSRTKAPSYSESASRKTFGHTGFTGTCVWADPEHDLIYIFLSNRVYPNGSNRAFFRSNIRQRIHEVIYDALETFDTQLPHLPVNKELAVRGE